MKKIDFHIHTTPSLDERQFDFDLNVLKEYTAHRKLDAIAVTNHNRFDVVQFDEIAAALTIRVFPGIEIDVENCHILLISDPSDKADFSQRCSQITQMISSPSPFISVEQLTSVFPDLGRYILIPHYQKKPAISDATLAKLRANVATGEVTSPKKFIHCIKNPSSLVPVYFSDQRMERGLIKFSLNQTYVDVGDLTLSALKIALADKSKVFLSEEDGHNFFEAVDGQLRISTGLNIVLGERSSGKSYTLDRICETFEGVKYIKQFSLLERDESGDQKKFQDILSTNHSLVTQEYLRELKRCVDDMSSVDIERTSRRVDQYLGALVRRAQESEREDAYSKARLFEESGFPISSLESLHGLIASIVSILENIEYRETIERHVSISSLKSLAVELMKKYSTDYEQNLKRAWVNELIIAIKGELGMWSAATPIPEIDFYAVAMERQKVKMFEKSVTRSKEPREISRKSLQGFQIVAEARPFRSAQEMKTKSGKVAAFSDAFTEYDSPYNFLCALRRIENIEAAEYSKFFVVVEYRILNRHGFDVSGGERSEFRLLQEIADAQNYDMLLVDEPESSFDNLFLKTEVNSLLKEIAQKVPVVVVTHNNTVGGSIRPDFVVYAKRNTETRPVSYELYFGHPGDKQLLSHDGKAMKNFDAVINCLEAGEPAYEERGHTYETLKT